MKLIGITLNALVLLALISPVAATEPPKGGSLSPVPGFEPDPASANGELGERGEWTFLAGSLAVRLTPLDQETRQAYLREHVGIGTDPFAGRPGETPPFVTFLLEVANGSHDPVTFRPQKSWLVTSANRVRIPMDRLTMESAYRMRNTEMPPAYHAAADLLLSDEVTLADGQKVVGLLAYESLPEKTRWFRIDMELTGPLAERIDFRAFYRKAKGKKKKR